MASKFNKKDILKERFGHNDIVDKARHLLEQEEQTEEEFLGAQAVLMLQGLI